MDLNDPFYTFDRRSPLPNEAPTSQVVFQPAPDVEYAAQPSLGGGGAVTRLPFGLMADPDPEAGEGDVIIGHSYFVDFDETIYNVNPWSGTLGTSTKVWAKVTVAGTEATDFEVETGSDWPDSRIELDGSTPPVQTALYVRIGYVEAFDPDDPVVKPGFNFTLSGDTYHFVQLLNAHQQLFLGCANGTPAVMSRGGA